MRECLSCAIVSGARTTPGGVIAQTAHFHAHDDFANPVALGIEQVRYFADEATLHHFHVWMVPVMPWMEPFGRSVEAIRPALAHARATMQTPEGLADVRHAVSQLRRVLP